MRPRCLLACGLLLASVACAGSEPSVRVGKLGLDIAFGLPPLEEQARPPGFIPSLFPTPDRLPPGAGTKPPPREPRDTCTRAPLNAFPLRDASFDIAAPPVEEAYRWKRDGSQTIDGRRYPLSGFETRRVHDVTTPSPTKFTFKTSQIDLDRRKVVTTWTVNMSPTTTSVSEQHVGEPERGLSLSRIETFDQGGTLEATFAPVVPVLYLPLPLDPDESWTSVGLDPATGQVLEHDAQIEGAERIDACGTPVEGWRVSAVQTLNGGQAVRTYQYVVAPQYGGLLIKEKVASTSARDRLSATFHIAQVPRNAGDA